MNFILNNLYSNLGILSSIKIYIPCEFNINNFYFDMDISLFNDKILYILENVFLLLLLITIIYFSYLYVRDKMLVNFNESQVDLYDSGDNIDCSSSSAEGNYTSSDSDDGEDDDTKLSRRRRRWQKYRDYTSKYAPNKKAYSMTKNNNKNYNIYLRAARDVYCQGQEPAIPRNHVFDKKMYKNTVRELNKAKLENPNLNLDLDTLCRLHISRYSKYLYNKYNYNTLTPDLINTITKKYNISALNRWGDQIKSIDSEKLTTYLNISEKIHTKYIERVYLHSSKWDGWFVRQIAKIISRSN